MPWQLDGSSALKSAASCATALYCDPSLNWRRLYAVSRRLGDLTGGAKLAFIVTPKGSLAGRTPLQALAEGNIAAVLNAADGAVGR